ncbi:MAG: hypothetical protein AVDCRST_MAG89-1230, partial [uncultured Gemmatimonadetes bacterium]
CSSRSSALLQPRITRLVAGSPTPALITTCTLSEPAGSGPRRRCSTT